MQGDAHIVSTTAEQGVIGTCGPVLAVPSDIPSTKLEKRMMDYLKIGIVEAIKELVNHHPNGGVAHPEVCSGFGYVVGS